MKRVRSFRVNGRLLDDCKRYGVNMSKAVHYGLKWYLARHLREIKKNMKDGSAYESTKHSRSGKVGKHVTGFDSDLPVVPNVVSKLQDGEGSGE